MGLGFGFGGDSKGHLGIGGKLSRRPTISSRAGIASSRMKACALRALSKIRGVSLNRGEGCCDEDCCACVHMINPSFDQDVHFGRHVRFIAVSAGNPVYTTWVFLKTTFKYLPRPPTRNSILEPKVGLRLWACAPADG